MQETEARSGNGKGRAALAPDGQAAPAGPYTLKETGPGRWILTHAEIPPERLTVHFRAGKGTETERLVIERIAAALNALNGLPAGQRAQWERRLLGMEGE